jgi:hypothetical protein
MDQEEGRRRLCHHRPLRQREPGRQQPRQQPSGTRPERTPRNQQQQREQHVELLLDRQTPGVQQGLELGGGVEITALPPEQEVGQEQSHRRRAGREIRHVAGQQPEPGERDAGGDHHEQRRQDAPRTPLVEMRQRKTPGAQILEQDGGDQIAADDEEHVDTNEAARQRRRTGVKTDHR